MKDDAVAPVVAVMLILAVIVTFLSVWNAVVIPSLKQSSEIEHLRNVESAFQHFSSDIERAVSLRQDRLLFSEPVQLGGGDVMFDSLRSGGSLSVRNERIPLYNITLYNGANRILTCMNGTIVAVRYEPANNYWQDQGYQWQYGYINVSKYGTRATPLGHTNMTEVRSAATSDTSSLALFARSFGTVRFSMNGTLLPDSTKSYAPRTGNCSGIEIIAVNITASPDHPFVSSNGYGTLALTSTVNRTPYYSVGAISFGSAMGTDAFRNAAFSGWNSSFSELSTRYCQNNIAFDAVSSDAGFSRYTFRQSVSPVNLTMNAVEIRISAS